MRLRLSVLVLGLAACRGEPPVLRADVPIESSDRSLILGFQRGAELQLQAFDVVAGKIDPPWMLDLGEEDVGVVYALAYKELLATLDVRPGPLARGTADVALRPLPAPDRIQQRRLNLGVLDEWSIEPDLDEALAAVRFPVGCVSFEPRTYPLPEGLDARFMVVAGGRVLIGNTANDLYVAEKGGTFIKLGVTGEYYDAYAQEDGTIYFGGRDGTIDRGTFAAGALPRLTLTQDSTIAFGSNLAFIDGDPKAGGVERSVITENGWWALHDATGWHTAYNLGSARDLSWIGNGLFRAIDGDEYFTVGPIGSGTAELQDSVHGQAIDGGLTDLGYAPLVGPLAGTHFGAVYVRQSEDEWTPVRQLEAAMLQIRGLVGYRFGFVYARPEAIVEVEGLKVCPTVLVGSATGDAPQLGDDVDNPLPSEGRAELSVLGRDVLVLGRKGPSGDRHPHLFWFSAL